MEMSTVYQIMAIIIFIITTIFSYFLLSYKLFISNLFIISSYLIVVPSLFFTYGSYIEQQVVKTQIIRIIDDIKDSAYILGITIPSLDITIDKSLDAQVEKQNRELIIMAVITLMIASFIGYISVIYLWWRKKSFSFKGMLVRDVILLLLIVLVEIIFFTVVSKNYRSIDVNTVKYHILTDLANKVNPNGTNINYNTVDD